MYQGCLLTYMRCITSKHLENLHLVFSQPPSGNLDPLSAHSRHRLTCPAPTGLERERQTLLNFYLINFGGQIIYWYLTHLNTWIQPNSYKGRRILSPQISAQLPICNCSTPQTQFSITSHFDQDVQALRRHRRRYRQRIPRRMSLFFASRSRAFL